MTPFPPSTVVSGEPASGRFLCLVELIQPDRASRSINALVDHRRGRSFYTDPPVPFFLADSGLPRPSLPLFPSKLS